MLVSEYAMVAKGLDSLSTECAERLLETILRQVQENIGATIADVWQTREGRDGILVEPLTCTGGGENRECKAFQVSEETKGMLAWAVRQNEPVWLSNIREQAANDYILNLVTNGEIETQYLDSPETTNSTMVVPINYSGKLRGLLSIESPVAEKFNKADLETLKDIASPTGILLWKLQTFQQNSAQTKDAIESFRRVVDRSTTRLNPYRTGFIARPFRPEFERLAKKLADIFHGNRIRATEYNHPPGSDLVMSEIINQVAAAHFGVVDITGMNYNVMLELGMFMGLGKPSILFREKDDGMDLPFDLAGFNLYRYGLDGDELKLWRPAQTGHVSAEEVIRQFIDDRLMTEEAFVHAREWIM